MHLKLVLYQLFQTEKLQYKISGIFTFLASKAGDKSFLLTHVIAI